MKIEALPFTVENFLRHAPAVAGSDALAQSLGALMEGEAAIFLSEDQCFGMGGFAPLWPGVAEGWMLLNQERFRHPVFLRRWALAAMRRAADRLKLHRIQGAADPEGAHHARWLKSLGFAYEGLLRQYTFDRRDMALYALTL